MRKKLIAVVLSTCMLASAVPYTVPAVEVSTGETAAAAVEESVASETAAEESENEAEEVQDQTEKDAPSEEPVIESTEETADEDGRQKENISTSAIRSKLFSDVTDPTHPYYNPIYWASGKGITTGFSNGTFRPYTNCTRGQVVTFLWRLAGKPNPSSSTKVQFSDMVSSSHPYYKAIRWAVQKGITTGFNDGTFRPFDNCSRGQIVTFIYRYAGRPSVSGKSAGFKDMVSRSHPFYNAITWASSKSITTGFSNNTFGPAQQCTRGQVVTFLYRYSNSGTIYLRDTGLYLYPDYAAYVTKSGSDYLIHVFWTTDGWDSVYREGYVRTNRNNFTLALYSVNRYAGGLDYFEDTSTNIRNMKSGKPIGNATATIIESGYGYYGYGEFTLRVTYSNGSYEDIELTQNWD